MSIVYERKKTVWADVGRKKLLGGGGVPGRRFERKSWGADVYGPWGGFACAVCGKDTSYQKPYCIDHINMMPYIAAKSDEIDKYIRSSQHV